MNPRRWLRRASLPLLVAVAVLADLALPWRGAGRLLGTAAGLAIVAVLVVRTGRTIRQLRRVARVEGILRTRVLETLLTLGAAALLATKILAWARGGSAGAALDHVYDQYAVAFLIVVGLRLAVAQLRFRHILHRLQLEPSQTVAAGFALTILGGGLLLSMPFSVTSLDKLDILDALFTATSAVTVTGLAVYDPGTHLTLFGQGLLLLLIQVGGMGTMAATASLVMLAGRRMQLRQATALQETMDLETVGHVRGMLVTVVGVTLATEAVGAVLLHLAWRDLPGGGHPLVAVFHAVSAFCNAGFSLFPRSLVPIVDRPAANAVIASLIVMGGLGFPVLGELGRRLRGRRRGAARGLSLQARLVLLSTGVLLVSGTIAILIFEWSGTLAPHSLPVRLLAAAFQSVTARTAGFNTLDIAAMAPATLTLLMPLMFVGGSPGGTAGGIKTTTAATILLTLRTVLRGQVRVEAFRRTIPLEQVHKALALFGLSAALLLVGTLLLMIFERIEPVRLAFEAVSAFSTTGLSAGVTPALGSASKIVVMLLMFAGRAGPMTLAFALAARQRPAPVSYPEEKIMLG